MAPTAPGPGSKLCPSYWSCSASLYSAGETEAQLRNWPRWVRVPAQEAAWLGAQSGGEGLCESLLSPRRPQAGWVKGGCSPPASPPTWAQTMGLCARRGRVVKVRSPGPQPWPQPPPGQGGRARGCVGAGKSSKQASKASLRSSQQRKRKHREGAPGTQGHTAHGHQFPSCCGLMLNPSATTAPGPHLPPGWMQQLLTLSSLALPNI